MWADIRYALQGFWRSPAFTISATLALGLAIGANATIFSLVDGLWLRPPGAPRTSELVRIFSTTPTEREGYWSYPEYLALRDGTTSFAGVAAKGPRGATMDDAEGTPELLYVNVVSTNFFATLGVQPAAGRLFAPGDEEALERQPGVVLGHAFWQRRFGGDPGIVGSTIALSRGGRVPVTVLAVLPSSFRDLDAAGDRDLWMPPQTWSRLAGREEFEAREQRWFQLVARRAPGVAVSTARADAARVAADLASSFPATNAGRGVRVVPDLDYRLETGGVNASALLGLVLLVVVITCVNVANLLLARGAARARELAIRVALGAGRRRLLRQLMTESALLGALGALAGFTIAMWAIRVMPALLGVPPGARAFTVFQLDARVVFFTMVVTMVTTCLFGIVPSWLASRGDVAPVMKEGTAASGPRVNRGLQQGLVVSQIAVSVVLLCGAAVMTRSFLQTERAGLGVTRQPVLSAWVSGEDFTRAGVEEAMARLAATPGVERVAIAFRAPLSLSGGGMARPVYFPDAPPASGEGLPDVKFNPVSASYFDTMGTRVLRGRVLTRADEGAGEPVMVVNEEFERRFFPGGTALDRRVQPGGPTAPVHRIVGVVENAVINSIGEEPEPYFYLPFWRRGSGEVTFLVRTTSDASAFAPIVRDTLESVDPRLRPRRIVTMREYMAYSASDYRATAALALALGLVGLLLTVLGVYGVIAYRTARRTREIGIRMALGAARGDVLRMMLIEGSRVAVAGVGIGLVLALAATRAIRSMLFHVSAWDPASFTTSAVVVLALACVAIAIPAWRAVRSSPAAALRL